MCFLLEEPTFKSPEVKSWVSDDFFFPFRYDQWILKIYLEKLYDLQRFQVNMLIFIFFNLIYTNLQIDLNIPSFTPFYLTSWITLGSAHISQCLQYISLTTLCSLFYVTRLMPILQQSMTLFSFKHYGRLNLHIMMCWSEIYLDDILSWTLQVHFNQFTHSFINLSTVSNPAFLMQCLNFRRAWLPLRTQL